MDILKWVSLNDIDIAFYRYKYYRRMYLIDKTADAYRLYVMYVGDYISEIRRVERKTKEELIFLAKLDAKVMDFSIKDRESLEKLYSCDE